MMKSIVESLLKEALHALQRSGELPGDVNIPITVGSTKEAVFGDFSSNLALLLAPVCRTAPNIIASLLIKALPPHEDVAKVEVNGPGFINFFMEKHALTKIIAEVLRQGQDFGQSEGGQWQGIIFEFGSSNPLSPLQVAHGRSSVFEAPLDNLELARSNPVYTIQYATVRICSLFKQVKERGLIWDKIVGLSHLHLLDKPQEISLMSLISHFPDIIGCAAARLLPHQLLDYLKDLAEALHSYYNAVPLICEEEQLRASRLCLLEATQQIFNNGLNLLGISAPESM